jgi:PIN domain nuclease of toxin-antitoxin system
MKLLLDTHILLWSAHTPSSLSDAARILISDPRNIIVYSAANIWEVAIKRALGRPNFAVDPASLRGDLQSEGWIEIPIISEHGIAAAALPPLHKDPFDRILIGQAVIEGCLLVTADAAIAAYPGPIILV